MARTAGCTSSSRAARSRFSTVASAAPPRSSTSRSSSRRAASRDCSGSRSTPRIRRSRSSTSSTPPATDPRSSSSTGQTATARRRLGRCSRAPTRTEITTAACSRSARTAGCTSRWATEAPAATRRTAPRTPLALRQAPLAQRRHEGGADRGTRPPQRVAILLRPRERRPLHRRRRPGRDRGGRLHAGEEPRPRELRLGRLRGEREVRGQGARPRRARGAGRHVQPPGRVLDHRRLYLPRLECLAARPLHLRRLLQRHIWSFKLVGGKATT